MAKSEYNGDIMATLLGKSMTYGKYKGYKSIMVEEGPSLPLLPGS
jgi:hypothetical protein